MAKCRCGDPAIRCRSRSPILTGYKFVSDNWEFERAIHASILVRRYGFPPLPIEQQDCAQRLALANAYPAELGLRCEALGLPYCKSPEARKAMLRLSRPQTAKKRKNAEDPAARERDLALLLERCKNDVRATRAAYNSPRLRPLLPEERRCCCSTRRSTHAASAPMFRSSKLLGRSLRRSVTPSIPGSTS